jgi:hypothetical protein
MADAVVKNGLNDAQIKQFNKLVAARLKKLTSVGNDVPPENLQKFYSDIEAIAKKVRRK